MRAWWKLNSGLITEAPAVAQVYRHSWGFGGWRFLVKALHVPTLGKYHKMILKCCCAAPREFEFGRKLGDAMPRTGTLMPWSQHCCDALSDLTLRGDISWKAKPRGDTVLQGERERNIPCQLGGLDFMGNVFHQEADVAFNPAKVESEKGATYLTLMT